MRVWPDFADWPATPEAAIALQKALRGQLRLEDDFDTLETLAGVDVGYDMQHELSHASIVLFRRRGLEVLATAQAFLPTTFPYVSGLLAFREIPVLVEALKMMPRLPDLLMVDGMGIAHPRRMGIAAHLGVLLDMPAIGVGKSRLWGRYGELGEAKGSTAPLMDKGEQIGTVLRSKERCNPLFISPGHRVSLQTALDLTLETLGTYRLPEPTRLADKLSKVKKEEPTLF